MDTKKSASPVATAIEPWLTVNKGQEAAVFYASAFAAAETYRMEMPDGGLIVKFDIAGAGFWISYDAGTNGDTQPVAGDGGPVRMIMIVSDPDTVFAQAVTAGATVVFPVGEAHGWRLGRLQDPFGHHWEIGHLL